MGSLGRDNSGSMDGLTWRTFCIEVVAQKHIHNKRDQARKCNNPDKYKAGKKNKYDSHLATSDPYLLYTDFTRVDLTHLLAEALGLEGFVTSVLVLPPTSRAKVLPRQALPYAPASECTGAHKHYQNNVLDIRNREREHDVYALLSSAGRIKRERPCRFARSRNRVVPVLHGLNVPRLALITWLWVYWLEPFGQTVITV